MSARGWADRLSGGRGDPSSPPPGPERDPDGGHPDLGPGYPVPANGPDLAPSGPILCARPPVPEPRGSALRVVLVSRDNMLAGALRSLIEAPGGVRMLDWHSDELDGAIRRADVVVVDMPPNLHERTFAVIDGRFLGRTVVLLQEGEHAEALPPGPPRAILYRPLQIAELWAAVTGAGPDEGRGLKGEVPGPGSEPVGSEEASGPDVGLAAADDAVAGAEERPGAEIDVSEPDSEPEAGAEDQAAAMQGPGLSVAESGMLIGLSGRELESVVGPGQVAPGMDEETFERLRRWGSRGRQPAPGTAGTAGARRANGTRAGRASAEARREQSRRQRVAKAEAKAATREEVARQRAARAEARTADKAEVRKAAQEEERRVKAAEAEARKAVEEEARRVKAARAAEEAVAREEARKAKAAAQEVARRAQSVERAAAREAAQREKSAREEVRKAARAERAEARRVAREESRQARAVRVAARRVTRAEASQVRATRRKELRQVRQAKAEVNRAARAQARQERAAATQARREQSRQARAAQAQARQAEREHAGQENAVRAEEQRAAREAAARVKAAQAAVKREETRQAKAAQAAARAAQQEAAREAKAAQAEVGRTRVVGPRVWAERVVQPVLVVVVLAVVAVAAAGWRSGGGPDTQAGEVAVVRAAGGTGGGLVAQDPRMGPVSPLHALAVGTWLRMTETKASLEGTVREARVPGRFLLAVVVALTVVLFLLLIRVGPGTGAAAGPGPAPPQGWERARRIGGAALAGVLVALDPLLVRNAREATGTTLALLLALGALALAWSVPARPALRWLPLVAALGGLAVLVSPLVLPVLVVPVAADLLGGRHREAWRSMAALAIGIGVWLLLPIWVAGQDLGPGQAGWLLGRPPGRGPVAVSLAGAPLSWLLVAAGLAAAILTWRHRSGARPEDEAGSDRPLAWVATTAAGALVAVALGYPAGQALAFATPAAAVALALACGRVVTVAARGGTRGTARRLALAATVVALAGLVVAQGVDWSSRYAKPGDDGLGKLVATVAAQVPSCSAVNASGPDDRARLLAAGVTVTEFSDGQAAAAAGVRYFVLTGATATGGPLTPSLAAWVREHGNRLAAHPSPSLSGVELWRVDPAPLDPVADSLPIPGGMYSNVTGSACGGYRVVDSQLGAFYTAYRAVGGKAVLGRPLGSVWTSDGPALQAFDTMVLGAVPAGGGPPAVKPIELPPLLAKLDVEAVADADIPLPSTRPPVTDRQAMALLGDEMIARAYLGTDPATATPEDWRRARDRFGRPLGTPQTMPDGAVRQPFEKAVLELPADGGPARPAALGRLAVRLGLVPKQAMRPEPVPGLPARPAETRLDTGPLLGSLGLVLGLLVVAAAAGAATARRHGPTGQTRA